MNSNQRAKIQKLKVRCNGSHVIVQKEIEKPGEITPRAMFLSAGGCDEYIQIFLYEITVPRAQLEEWTGKLTGLREEGEKVSNFTYSSAPLFQIGLPHLSFTPLSQCMAC